MKKGKIIVIEGTDCSGKETQTKRLYERLSKDYNVKTFDFPHYNSPSGKIVGGPFLGRKDICEGWFPEEAPNVDPDVSNLYYAADRKYNLPIILEWLDNGNIVILDRYTYSGMAHQGSKITDKKKRNKLYERIETLEFDLLGLPEPDIKVFLHMPFDYAAILKKNRGEFLDQNEKDDNHLKMAEMAFRELANKYNFKTIECVSDYSQIASSNIKTIDKINDELYNYVKEQLK